MQQVAKSARRPLVFVTQEGPFNYQPAEDFGELTFLSVKEITPNKGSPRNEAIVGDIQNQMQHYIPGVDYILLSGSPIAMAYTLREAFRKGPTHNLLKWDGQAGTYFEYRI